MNKSSWELIQEILSRSNREILFNNTNMVNTKVILDKLKISGNSFVGAIIQNTSGVVIDNWIRLLGSDSKKNRGIVSYNLINEDGIAEKIDKMLIVADDIVGGVFALNAGRFSEEIGDVWYFAPDTLEWESLNMKYSEGSFYVRNTNQGIIEYTLISFTNNLKGFCCEIKFVP